VSHTAVGKSKKLAKRSAALAMLNAIRLGGVEPNVQVVEPDEYEDEDPIALVSFDFRITVNRHCQCLLDCLKGIYPVIMSLEPS